MTDTRMAGFLPSHNPNSCSRGLRLALPVITQHCTEGFTIVVSSLGDLLHPLSQQQFLDEVWGKTFHHIAGRPEKFADLYSWDELSRVLQEHRLTSSRLRLFRGGKQIEPQLYRHSADSHRLSEGRLLDQLHQGGTLVVDFIDDSCSPLRELIVGMEAL